MISLSFDSDRLLSALDFAGAEIDDSLTEELSREFELIQDENFLKKSVPFGGTGTDGIKWDAHSQAWAKVKGHNVVGFWRGHLRALVDFGYDDDSFFYRYLTTYAEHFDKLRPLMPSELPVAWQEQLEERAIQWVDDLLDERFSAA